MGSAVARQGARKGDFLAGKYLLEDCLGIGGMGEVYRAQNVALGRKVAIKLLSAEFVHIEEDVLRFLREARAAAAIRHANVVDVFDVARDDDGTPFIVQELLAGEDLERYLKTRGGRLSPEEALEIMIPVADAVAAAHAQNVVHRDLKPANIFLARDRNKITPKVLDFGACLFPTIAERTAKEIRMLIGTPHYMAPEQIVSKADVGAPSDVWALGVILYEMLVGETPFEAETANAVLNLVKTVDVPPLRQMVKDAPKELDELIAKCTKRDRLERFKNAGELHEQMLGVRRRMRGERPASRTDTIGEMPAPVIRPPAPAPAAAAAAAAAAIAPAKSDNRRDPDSSPKLPAKVLAKVTPKKITPQAPPLPRAPVARNMAPRTPAGDFVGAPRNKALLTLSSPGSEPPGGGGGDIPKARGAATAQAHELDLPFPTAPDALPSVPSLNLNEPTRPSPLPQSAQRAVAIPSSLREIEAAEETFGEASLDLAARPSSWPPPAAPSDDRRSSSMPPVLDPRAASSSSTSKSRSKKTPSVRPPPVFTRDVTPEARDEHVDEAPLSPAPTSPTTTTTTNTGNKPRPPAILSREDPNAARALRLHQSWSMSATAKFVAAVALPAVAAFMAVLVIPALGTPVGRALRGDSTFASGVLAVIALVASAGVCARAFLGERDRWMYLAAIGSALFGIVMIIVTFSASEAAELGVPASMSGVSTIVAPIAPLAVALGALLKARTAWLDPYGKSERIRYAALASTMLFLALALSPMGAVRTPSHPPKALHFLVGS